MSWSCNFTRDWTLSVSTLQVFAIVVFGTISDQGYYSPTSKTNGTCMFNNNECACSYAVGVGVLAFVACVVFPILDVIISKISSATAKDRIVKGDLAFSGKSALTAMPYSSLKEQKSTKEGSAACHNLKLSSAVIFSPEFVSLLWITWQRLWPSCGSSVSVSCSTSGPELTPNMSWLMLPELPLLSPSSQSSPGYVWHTTHSWFGISCANN